MTPRPAVAVLVACLVVALAAPASADSVSDLRAKRDAAHTKRAQLAAKLDAMKATDGDLQNAVTVLDKQVAAQQAAADAARQSVQAAVDAVTAADAKLADTERRIGDLKAAVVHRAVSEYVQPHQDAFGGLLTTTDLGEASRREALLRQANDRARDIVDRLRSARMDLADQQKALTKARDLAAERRKAVLSKLSDLQNAQADKERLAAAFKARLAVYQQEADAVAQQESGLVALIQSKEAALRASRGGNDTVDGRISGTGLIWPMRGTITSPFGPRWGGFHPGIDIATAYGTPIHAAKGGTVIFAGWQSGYGNYTCIDHGGGFSTCYAHQSQIAVSDGQQVSQGQVIGYEGNTGYSTGPHLHFETRVNGTPQNPMKYLP
ncbi:MAG TPA: peptidoglycan DD-metalloendopeptidase family protein [Acidimicrobiales bacterium]|nr:peptidoglycan DD-metalloendopeptidase family protein [Acidimicrobiales bacterium]